MFQPHYHGVQFYKDSGSLAATAARFLADGLIAGQPALLVATRTHAHAINEELTTAGFESDELRMTDRLHVIDARKLLRAFMIGDRPDPLMFRSNIGTAIERLSAGRPSSPIRVYGEMVDLLWHDGNANGAIRLEILWNQLASAYEFELLCGYAVGHFFRQPGDSPDIEDVCRHHSHIVPSA